MLIVARKPPMMILLFHIIAGCLWLNILFGSDLLC